MEIKILSDGYKNNEAFYQDFLNGTIEENPDYFSEVSVELDKAEDFPIYMAKGSDEEKKAEFKKAFQVLARDYINTSRDVNMDELFWHSFLCVKKREYIL